MAVVERPCLEVAEAVSSVLRPRSSGTVALSVELLYFLSPLRLAWRWEELSHVEACLREAYVQASGELPDTTSCPVLSDRGCPNCGTSELVRTLS